MKNRLLQHYVAEQASRRPEATAIAGDEPWSYAELEERSARIASALRAGGCAPGDRVALLLPHGSVAVAALLGTYRAGCVAVPMELTSPAARLARALEACRPACLLGAGRAASVIGKCRALLDGPGWTVGWLEPGAAPEEAAADFGLEEVNEQPLADEAPRSADDPAHILFTSGSTGQPKGIAVTHANARHFVDWGVAHFGIGPDDRNSSHTQLHFDLSTFDLFGTFAAGAQLHPVPPEAGILPARLADFIRERRLTQWFSVPTALGYLRKFDVVRRGDFPTLRRVMWCGEVLPVPTLAYWMERVPHARYTNLYGPTETTIASSHYTVSSPPSADETEIPIGRACTGEELLVLDEHMQPVAPGVPGELYIGGPGVTLGYWNDPERTGEAFVPHPQREGERLYRTGDLARRDDDGLFYFLGRVDSQVKSRGYRIELGEVEQAVHGSGLVAECAVVALPTDGFEGARLCCAYSTRPGHQVEHAELRRAVRDLLPSYMVPTRWRRLDRLPVNRNGKIDRPSLTDAFRQEETDDAPAAA